MQQASKAARAAIAKLAKRVLKVSGSAPERISLCRKNRLHTLNDVASCNDWVNEALSIFDEGVRSGLALHDQETVSLIVRACCVPYAPWTDRERDRALRLFDSTQSRQQWQLHQDVEQAVEGKGRQAVSSGWAAGVESDDDVTSRDDDDDAPAMTTMPLQCEVSGCGAIARWGDAATGAARACEAHRREDESRVDLDTDALLDMADSVLLCGKHLERGAALHAYLTYSTGTVVHRGALNRLFGACARASRLPADAKALLPEVVSTGDIKLLNAYLNACGRAGLVDEAFDAMALAKEAGTEPDLFTVSVLVSAAGRLRQLERALDVMDSGRRAGLPVDTDVRIVSAVLKACAVVRDSRTATEAFECAISAGMAPTRAVLNALALAFASDGRLDKALEALDSLRERNDTVDMDTHGKPKGEAAAARDEDTSVATLLHACIRAGTPRRASELYETFTASGYTPSTSGPHAALLQAVAADAVASRAQADVDAEVEEATAAAEGMEEDTAPQEPEQPAQQHAQQHAQQARQRRATQQRATRQLKSIFDTALESGVRADARLVTSLTTALLTVGSTKEAYRAFERATDALGVELNLVLVRAVLRTCVHMRQREPLQRVLGAASAHGVYLRDASDLVLRAHVAAIPDARRDAVEEAELERSEGGEGEEGKELVLDVGAQVAIDEAMQAYAEGRRREWEHSPTARRQLLQACAEHDRLEEALEVLRDMQAAEIEPGFDALNEVMISCRRGGEIDEQTLQMWMSGSDPGPIRSSVVPPAAPPGVA